MSAEAAHIDPVAYARRWKTLAVLSLALVVIGLDNTVLNVALPSLQEHFHASAATLQWMVDSYLLVFAGLLLTTGALGDRFGRKKALLAGTAIFGGASLAVLAVDGSGELTRSSSGRSASPSCSGSPSQPGSSRTASRCSTSGTCGTRAFALFGAIFALTIYVQFAHGYSALEAGAAMVPIAFGLVIGAGGSSVVVERFGTTNVVAFGLLGFGVLLGTGLAWTPSMPYWPLGIWLFGTAMAMGLVMGPATESVMGAVPEAKAGVASAMNDVTRQVAGALGVAVIGSLISSFYASGVTDGLPELSEPARRIVEDSVGSAHALAATLPSDTGAQVVHAANSAFTDAMGIGFAVAAVIAVVAAVIVKRWLPAGHLPVQTVRRAPAKQIAAGARAR